MWKDKSPSIYISYSCVYLECGVHMFMCVPVCTSVPVSVHECVHEWRPEVGIQCLSQSLCLSLFEKRSLAQLGAHLLWLDWGWALRLFLPTPQFWGYRPMSQHCLRWILGFQAAPVLMPTKTFSAKTPSQPQGQLFLLRKSKFWYGITEPACGLACATSGKHVHFHSLHINYL